MEGEGKDESKWSYNILGHSCFAAKRSIFLRDRGWDGSFGLVGKRPRLVRSGC